MVFKLPSTFSNWLDLLPSPTHIRCHGLYYFGSWSSLKTNVIIYCQALIALTENDAPARFSVCHSGNICTSRYHNTYFAPQHQHTSTYIRVLCGGQVRVARPRGGVSEKYLSLGRKCKGRTVRFCCLRPHLCLNKQFWCCILNKSAHAKGGKSDRKSSLFRSWNILDNPAACSFVAQPHMF